MGFEPTNGGFADLSLGPLGYRAGFFSIPNLNSEPAIRARMKRFLGVTSLQAYLNPKESPVSLADRQIRERAGAVDEWPAPR